MIKTDENQPAPLYVPDEVKEAARLEMEMEERQAVSGFFFLVGSIAFATGSYVLTSGCLFAVAYQQYRIHRIRQRFYDPE